MVETDLTLDPLGSNTGVEGFPRIDNLDGSAELTEGAHDERGQKAIERSDEVREFDEAGIALVAGSVDDFISCLVREREDGDVTAGSSRAEEPVHDKARLAGTRAGSHEQVRLLGDDLLLDVLSLWVPETRPWSLTCRDAG